jgi:hypothetical protein
MELFAAAVVAATALGQGAKKDAGFVSLQPNKSLDGWESIGDGYWRVLRDGMLVGERDIRKTGPDAHWIETPGAYKSWRDTQSWLYTKRNDFGEFDLHVEYWLRNVGNSGISIRDTSRAQYAISSPPDFKKTPSKIGYEIQLNNNYPDKYPTGSIYTFQAAKTGSQIDDDWNTIEIESRNELIRVRLNGEVVAEHAGDPARSKTGPIGLQLHDQYCVAMFRNIRIREIK